MCRSNQPLSTISKATYPAPASLKVSRMALMAPPPGVCLWEMIFFMWRVACTARSTTWVRRRAKLSQDSTALMDPGTWSRTSSAPCKKTLQFTTLAQKSRNLTFTP